MSNATTDYLTINEAAGIVKLSRETIHRLIRQRKLQAYKCGGRTLIKPIDLNQLITPINN